MVGARSRAFAVARGTVLATSVLLLCRGITSPFLGWHELNSAMYAQFARNHLQYGLGYTALFCTWGDTAAPPPVPDRYLNHPPLIALWTAVPLALLGDHEWTARLTPIAATLGSVFLLGTILSRLGSPLLGLLGSFSFATLPLTLYFGRMIDHVAPVQFFTLLMLHGYLEWEGLYPGPPRPRRGVSCFVAGAVLGIGTGWAAVIPAALLWAWHRSRAARGSAERRRLLWLAGVPAAALAAVLLHILAGSGFKLLMLPELLLDRTVEGQGGAQPWSAWLSLQWVYFTRNFTLPGAIAALALLLVTRRALPGAPRVASALALDGDLGTVIGLTGLHGLLYVVLFKNQSWFHDYWQFFLGPFVATGLAGLALGARAALLPRAPRLAPVAAGALLLLPLPFAARSLAFYASWPAPHAEHVRALRRLGELVPKRAPVWTSVRWRTGSETFGGWTSRWPHPVIEYYANRPLLYTRDTEEVKANRPGCAAYLLVRGRKAWSHDLEATLARSYEGIPVGPDHEIFLLPR